MSGCFRFSVRMPSELPSGYSGIRKKHSKNESDIKLITKNFVALGFKAKMVINKTTQLPLEVILTPKE